MNASHSWWRSFAAALGYDGPCLVAGERRVIVIEQRSLHFFEITNLESAIGSYIAFALNVDCVAAPFLKKK